MKYSDETLLYYNKNADSFIESTVNVDFSRTQELFLDYIKSSFKFSSNKDIKILDFGCGSGRDTRYFLDKGFSVEAIDGSLELCATASRFTGIKVKQQLFQEWQAETEYNGIWACSSILHLDINELKQVIKKLRKGLVDSGILYTSFKYGNFKGLRNGRYFIDLTESSFADLINEITGFQIIEEWISDDVRSGREAEKWLNVIIRKI